MLEKYYPAELMVWPLFLLFFSACQKEENGPLPPGYDIPSVYEFENVDYSGQLQRLSMLQEMKTYMRSANTPGTVLDFPRLSAMYANDASIAGWAQSYDESKQLKSKTFEDVQVYFELVLKNLASASQSSVEAREGQAGIAVSADGSKRYLLGPKGLEHAQISEKGIMGACFYYQATSVYLGAERMNVDNDLVVSGQGTKMEHHWDEAFGYLGVPRDFPLDTDGLAFWGSYCDARDELLATNQRIMDAFLKGRAAISNGDLKTRDDAIAEVRQVWEEIVAGTALHYFNKAIKDYDDFAARAHALSEGLAFVYALQFNPAKRLSNQEVSELLMLTAGSGDFFEMNVYATDMDRLIRVRDQLAEAFDMETIKEQF